MKFPRRAHMRREGNLSPQNTRGSFPKPIPLRESTLIFTSHIFQSNPEWILLFQESRCLHTCALAILMFPIGHHLPRLYQMKLLFCYMFFEQVLENVHNLPFGFSSYVIQNSHPTHISILILVLSDPDNIFPEYSFRNIHSADTRSSKNRSICQICMKNIYNGLILRLSMLCIFGLTDES